MNHLWPDQAPYTVCNSSLSEYGVPGRSDSATCRAGPETPEDRRVAYILRCPVFIVLTIDWAWAGREPGAKRLRGPWGRPES